MAISKQFTTAALNLLVSVIAENDDSRIHGEHAQEDAKWFSMHRADLTDAFLKEAEDVLERTFIAIAPNYWGEGPTIERALASLKQNGGASALQAYVVKSCPPGSSVGDMGGIEYPNACKLLGLPTPFEVASKKKGHREVRIK